MDLCKISFNLIRQQVYFYWQYFFEFELRFWPSSREKEKHQLNNSAQYTGIQQGNYININNIKNHILMWSLRLEAGYFVRKFTNSFPVLCYASQLEYVFRLQDNLSYFMVQNLLYHNQTNARALIGESAMVYCAGKPMEISRVFWIIARAGGVPGCIHTRKKNICWKSKKCVCNGRSILDLTKLAAHGGLG